MAEPWQVLNYLIPEGGYVQIGDAYEGIEFIECEPITKKQYEDGFAQFDAWKAEQDAKEAAKKQAILDRLGLTNEEARLILK